MCTGAQGDLAVFPVPAMTQGALFSFATAAARENESTNVRFNEVYLSFRVEVDEEAAKHLHEATKASEFARVYEMVLGTEKARGWRVRVEGEEDLAKLRGERKF
jgi:hypothetical protein